MNLTDYDNLRSAVQVAAQTAYVQALVAGDTERAVALFPVAQHGSIEESVLRDLGFEPEADAIYNQEP